MRLMQEPLELQVPAMLAYLSFPEEWFAEVGLFHEDVKQLDSVVLAFDEHAFAMKKGWSNSSQKNDHCDE